MSLLTFKTTETQRKYLGFNDYWFIILGIPLCGFLIPTLFFGVRWNFAPEIILFEWAESAYFSTGHWLSCRWMLIQLRKRYPSFKDARRRILLQMVMIIFLAIAIDLILICPHFFVTKYLDLELVQPSSIIAFGATFMVSFLVMAIYESIYFYHQLKTYKMIYLTNLFIITIPRKGLE